MLTLALFAVLAQGAFASCPFWEALPHSHSQAQHGAHSHRAESHHDDAQSGDAHQGDGRHSHQINSAGQPTAPDDQQDDDCICCSGVADSALLPASSHLTLPSPSFQSVDFNALAILPDEFQLDRAVSIIRDRDGPPAARPPSQLSRATLLGRAPPVSA
jgi:hypothetical protein